MSSIYLTHSIDMIPRLLSLMDRDPYSPTRGCCDRLFWGWKLKDYPDATLQRLVFPLAMLWKIKKNPWYKSALLEKSIKAGIQYWGEIQHRNGSVDQAFPNEFSFGASAFSLCDIIKAYNILEPTISDNEKDIYLKPIRQCADFLLKSNETHGLISNHLAGAALALLEAHQLFGNEYYKKKAQEILGLIINNQSVEGWYVEYAGFDPGYQTLATYYLAQCWTITKDDKLLLSIKKSILYLKYFIHPDSTIGGSHGSRNTEIYYPGGLEILKNELPEAGLIANKMRTGIETKKTVQLCSLDDGNLAPLLSNYLIATMYNQHQQTNKKQSGGLPCDESNCEEYFPHSQIYIKSTKKYYCLFSIAKGGVIKIYNKQKKEWVWDDGGYLGQLKNGRLISSQMLLDNTFQLQKNSIESRADFYHILNTHPTPFKFLFLRFLNLTVMQNLSLGNFVKDLLVKLLISGKKKVPVTLTRKLILNQNSIVIEDFIKQKGHSLKWLKFGFPFTTIHMASSKYYQENQKINHDEHTADISELNLKNQIKIKTKLDFT